MHIILPKAYSQEWQLHPPPLLFYGKAQFFYLRFLPDEKSLYEDFLNETSTNFSYIQNYKKPWKIAVT